MTTPEHIAEHVLACGSCDKVNASRARFCAGCGDPLWETCLACEQEKLIAEAYCNECGAGVEQQLGKVRSDLESDILRARQLAQQHHYGRAIESLQRISKLDHYRFRDHVDVASRLIGQFRQQRQEHQEHTERTLAEARELAAQNQWDRAAELLDGVPEAFRSDEFRRFRETLQQNTKSRTELEAKLRESLKQGLLHEASANLESLLAVDRTHAAARKLAGQLTDQLRRTARKEFKSHQYPQALETIRSIPSPGFDDQVRKEEAVYAEVVCLNSLIRQMPYADKTLLKLAQRVAELSPSDPRLKPVLQRLNERLAQSANSATSPRWARPPERTLLGAPIHRWEEIRRINNAGKTTQRGSCHVALGLALGGLGLAEIELNLKPAQRKGVLAAIGGLRESSPVLSALAGGRRKQVPTAWGIDLGQAGLKAVQLTVEEGGSLRLLQQVELPHERTAGQSVERDAVQRATVEAATLDRFVAQFTLDPQEPAVVNLPGDKLMTRLSLFPPMDDKRLRQAIEYEVVNQIPIPKQELVWQCHLPPPEQREYDRTVLIAAARYGEAERRVELFQQRGIKVHGMTADAIALHNLAASDGLLKPDDDPDLIHNGAVALVDVGRRHTQISFHWPNGSWCRCISHGTENWVGELSQQFKLTSNQAMELLLRPERARSVRRMVEVVDGVHGRFTHHLRQSHDAFLRDVTVRRVRGWLLVGGGSRLFGLLRYLRFGPIRC